MLLIERLVSEIWGALFHQEQAVTSIEYALLASLIAVVIIGAVASLGATLGGVWTSVASALSAL